MRKTQNPLKTFHSLRLYVYLITTQSAVCFYDGYDITYCAMIFYPAVTKTICVMPLMYLSNFSIN